MALEEDRIAPPPLEVELLMRRSRGACAALGIVGLVGSCRTISPAEGEIAAVLSTPEISTALEASSGEIRAKVDGEIALYRERREDPHGYLHEMKVGAVAALDAKGEYEVVPPGPDGKVTFDSSRMGWKPVGSGEFRWFATKEGELRVYTGAFTSFPEIADAEAFERDPKAWLEGRLRGVLGLSAR